MTSATSLWVYLASTPLLWLALTLTAYALAYRLFLASGMRPIVNPVVIAAGAIIALLLATGTSYDAYFDGAQFVHFLLGPAIVAPRPSPWVSPSASAACPRSPPPSC